MTTRAGDSGSQMRGKAIPKYPLYGLPPILVQMRGISVRRSRTNLNAVVADACDSLDRFLERIGWHPNRKAGVDPEY
ncbi:MAG: hypothetical protein JOY96_00010 [Verrucomicrobia bacterium]|nr:hypothetical protein [Verrucomicrobiota bacterium]